MAFSNFKYRADWILENEARRKEAAERGEDYNRLKMLEIGANEAERLERKNNKKNPDTGFADFEQVSLILWIIVIWLWIEKLVFSFQLFKICITWCVFLQATIRQYSRLVKELKPNMDEYEKTKAELGDAFYAGKNTILHGIHKDSPEAVNRMVEDLSKQIDKREKYSRRRRHDDDAEIDYINERNMRFNKKLDRFYGEFTTEIRQNLERGTAI